MDPRPLTLVTSLLLAALLAPSGHAAEFAGLGDLPGGSYYSEAVAVSADGNVVVGQSDSDAGRMAFRWAPGAGMAGLGFLPGGGYSTATAVTSDGVIIVGTSEVSSRIEAFRWTEASGIVGLGSLSGAAASSQANGISEDGDVIVGWSETSAGMEAFRWTQTGGMVGLGTLPGEDFSSQATGVSGDGSVVVGSSGTPRPTTEAFRQTASGMTGLGDLRQQLLQPILRGLRRWRRHRRASYPDERHGGIPLDAIGGHGRLGIPPGRIERNRRARYVGGWKLRSRRR